jgi:hypothetical protein
MVWVGNAKIKERYNDTELLKLFADIRNKKTLIVYCVMKCELLGTTQQQLTKKCEKWVGI